MRAAIDSPPNQGVREHHNLDDVPAVGAANTDAPAVGELWNFLVVEGEFINAVRAIEQRDAGCHWNPNSVLPPVLSPSVRFHRKLSTTRPQVDTSADKTGNEDQRLDGVEYARPKRAIGAGIVGCTWGMSRPRWTALRMTRCRFLRGKGHQSFFLP